MVHQLTFEPIQAKQIILDHTPFTYVTTERGVSDALRDLATKSFVAVDTETTGLNPHTSKVRLIQIGTVDHVYVFDMFRLPDQRILRYLQDKTVMKVFQNARFDLKMLYANFGVWVSPLYDTMVAEQILAGGRRDMRASLAELVKRYFTMLLPKEEQLSDWSANDLTHEQLQYAATDVAATFLVALAQYPRLIHWSLLPTAQLEFDCVPFTAYMEYCGVYINPDKWAANLEVAQVERSQLRDQIVSQLAPVVDRGLFGPIINIDSPQQLLQALHKLGFRSMESTGATVLKEYLGRHEVFDLLLKYRKETKRAKSYGMQFLDVVEETTNRIHPSFNQMGTDTGRFSCSSPNLQQIPRQKTYRSAFEAEPGNLLISADYSQIELRVAAHLSQDPAMLAIFRGGGDIHLSTGEALAERPITKEDPERQYAKAVNFGFIYGMGWRKFGRYARDTYGVVLTDEQSERFRNLYFAKYAGVATWHKYTAAWLDSIEQNYAVLNTLIGRRRYLFRNERGQFQLPAALNTPVQGTAGDMFKLAAGRIATRYILPEKVPSFKVVGMIHDEMLLECKEEEAPHWAEIVKNEMEAAGRELIADVPIIAEPKFGRTWAESH